MPKDRETSRRAAQTATARVFADNDTTLMQVAQKIVSLERKIDTLISAISGSASEGKKGKV